jgi:hypothetical protein
MKQKYSLHRGKDGMFIATFDNGEKVTGSLDSIREMYGPKDQLTMRDVLRMRREIFGGASSYGTISMEGTSTSGSATTWATYRGSYDTV